MQLYPILIYGIDNAGKTAIVLSLKHRKTVDKTLPTLAFNIEKIQHENLEFQIWDAPGQVKFRDIWKTGYQRAKVLVFILDTSDAARFPEAHDVFLNVLNDPMTRGVPLVFCYHKMDLPLAKTNLPAAKSLFALSSLRGRKMVAYETTIMDLKGLLKMLGTLVDIVLGVMF